MKFGLMFFASSEEALSGNKYQLVMESARFADANGFSSVWVPERHFTEFGSLYPNPAVLHAALAAATQRVKLVAGSVVAALHNPIRIAEEWSMVDNLSNGRVGVSFASGWNPDDFVFAPDKYATRQDDMLTTMRAVQHLWRGGTLDATNGVGKPVRLRIYPTPVQPELPVWVTAASNPQTFVRAGEAGANLLTHVLDQDRDQLAHKIALYREARANHGFDPAAGTVSVMLHTFVGDDAAQAREQARVPFCNYIRSNIGLLNGLAQSRGQSVDVRAMGARELDEFVEFLYERFAQSRGLIGTPETCVELVRDLESIGVDEVACLLDFGPPVERILGNLPQLRRLREMCASRRSAAPTRFDAAEVQARCTETTSGADFNGEIRQHGVQIDGVFDAIRQIWRTTGEALGKISLPADALASSPYQVHPAFLDACSRVLAAAIDSDALESGDLYLPSSIGAVRVHQPPASTEAWSHATLRTPIGQGALEGDIRVHDLAGRLLIEIDALRLQQVRAARAVERHDFAALLYQRVWRPSNVDAATGGSAPGEWLILADRGGVGAQLSTLLEAHGDTCTLRFADATPELPAADRPLKGVIHLWSLDLAPADIAARRRASASVLHLVRALASRAPSARQARLWLVTSGAMHVLDGESIAVAQAPLWGLGRAIAVEHAALWGGLVDLDPAQPSAADIMQAVQAGGREDMIAFRRDQRYVARIARDNREYVSHRPIRFHGDATYLVTGGLGGLGLRLASWLADNGAGKIVVLGRSEPSPAAEKILRTLDARFVRADLSRREDVADAISEIARSMPPLKGVFHLAGALDDALLTRQDDDFFHRAGSGKADGAWYLHELTADLPLDHFVLFSSMAALITMPGQGNYAAANSFLDALAQHRRAQGKPGLSVNWGPWAEIGHAATDYGRRAHEQLGALGVGTLPPELAIATLERLMASGVTQSGVAQIDWPTLFRVDAPAAGSALFSELAQPAAQPAQQETALLRQLHARAPRERVELITDTLAAMLAETLRLSSPDAIAPEQSLLDLGLDSLVALELTDRLTKVFGRPFRATLFFSYPNLQTLAQYVLNELSPSLPAPVVDEASGDLDEDDLSELIAQEIGAQ
ncbi:MULTISPECIES: bifunctional LLM class flavin-dependent oxidoreductase/SDR family oxidoreductase [Burkholderia]|jgi:phthiocerol/phenolphthiocerol synthesis type-I polyketide synthase D|uniref:LLM class flavin-dependent oxidoreductase n=6 Tax=Pseudomonadota TaxID=1224 RepID=A0A1E3FSC7_9BURK|nr:MULTISPECIES: bifunctional LLM class flavin-dependent oxidoreductase/SDR family oxidoreductase [Burkholderia]KKL42000.1 short-chain dehydrogenase [Burkholderia contaminans LMG 23361]MBA9829852.1 LLM class flavin-dependent oxidoreductase [Burkholderia contaminans]MBA9837148.1 LLM class flavin-dependent oxidoreductase [Burkholderia contaminans]MBA9861778.1 LLM class flavin-dependent oxidoreductase [Burkholderia contaminans]MBA9904908.1 LLM class flavin-dependent oxidoreductase [Burkholderia c